METWFIIIVTLCITTLIKSIISHRSNNNNNKKKLPPGPPLLNTIFLLLTNSPLKFEPVLVNLKAKYGPIFTLSFGFKPKIFVSDHSLTHEVLIQKGAIFSDRHKSLITRTISSSSYGPTWRTLRRNLASEMMHPARIKSFSWARKWVLRILIDRIGDNQESDGVKVVDHFRHAMFCLLVFMCFGEKVDDNKVNEIAKVHRDLLLKITSGRYNVLMIFPNLGRILFRNRWKELMKFHSDRDDVVIPLIKSRIGSTSSEKIVTYVDTLVNLQLPEEEGSGCGGGLTDKEMATICSEFLNAGTDTTSTALQWIMANLVKHPKIQSKLYDEIVFVVGPPPPPPQKGVDLDDKSVINEEDLQNMSYLKAVVLEGLRRHPPGHLVLPHRVMKEVEVQGYMIPEDASINFMVSEMGLDAKVWDEPMEFKPERFMVNDGVFDVSGSREIKMMPFGAGRRICPGLDLALLHLECFVANLIWYFKWTVPDGYHVDLSEKLEFTVVMKNPLRAQVFSRAQERTT